MSENPDALLHQVAAMRQESAMINKAIGRMEFKLAALAALRANNMPVAADIVRKLPTEETP